MLLYDDVLVSLGCPTKGNRADSVRGIASYGMLWAARSSISAAARFDGLEERGKVGEEGCGVSVPLLDEV